MSFDQILKQEIYFDHQKIDNESKKKFNDLLTWIVTSLIKGERLSRIKQHIYNEDIDPHLKLKLLERINNQQKIMTGDDTHFNLAQLSLWGYTFNEAIKEIKKGTIRRSLLFMWRARNKIKDHSPIDRLIKQELGNYETSYESFWQTQTKAAREYNYEKLDKRDKNIKGWISIAVLDRRTGVICTGLHNRFYSSKDYKNRSDIPNLPPRHPSCRSIVMRVDKDIPIKEYEGQTLQTFLERNPIIAEDLLGVKKAELWKKGDLKIKSYYDLKGERVKLFTNEEMVKKLSNDHSG